MKHQFTSVIEKRGRWYVAYIEEIPGVNTQAEPSPRPAKILRKPLLL